MPAAAAEPTRWRILLTEDLDGDAVTVGDGASARRQRRFRVNALLDEDESITVLSDLGVAYATGDSDLAKRLER